MWRHKLNKPSLLLVRSDDLGWYGIRSVVQSMSEVELAGEATDHGQAIQLASGLQPSLILTGTELNGASTIPLMEQFKLCSRRSKIAILARRIADDDLVPLA
jgi:DNA-binding NarL/FixJ family response regulator